MKKLIALLLALTLVFSMAACGSKDETPAPDGNTSNTETTARVISGPIPSPGINVTVYSFVIPNQTRRVF